MTGGVGAFDVRNEYSAAIGGWQEGKPTQRRSAYTWLLTLLFTSIFVQIEVIAISGRSLNIYHLLAALAMTITVANWLRANALVVDRKYLYVIGFLLTCIFPLIFSWRVGLVTVLPVFSVVYFVVGVQISKFSSEDRQKLYSFALISFVVATVFRDLAYLGDISSIYSRARTGCGCFLQTGGRNLEVTMLSVLALLYRGRYQFWLSVFVTVTATLFDSRVGIIGAVFLWSRYVGLQSSALKTVVLIFIVNAAVLSFFAFGDAIFGRFSIESELALRDKGVGRLALWGAALSLVPSFPFGVGPGQAVPAINASGYAFWENNIHNVPLTWILELGWFHGAIATLLLLSVVLKGRKVPEGLSLSYVFLTSIVEYTGYDVGLWIVIGIVFGLSARPQ